ncbi:sorting nexin-14-like [Huso huso]|uniref:Sorting nexin-14-like n=1 Tax=Huso huso TaxID=61971 RepID=A0ABR0ZUC0_HUSHU
MLCFRENWKTCNRLKVDLFRENVRQYPVFCFIVLFLLLSTVLLNRYLHILMIVWSFLAGVDTFYCSLGPESLLPNILFTIKPKPKNLELQELFPLGHSCAVYGKIKCKHHRYVGFDLTVLYC